MSNDDTPDQTRGLLNNDFTSLYNLFDDEDDLNDSPLRTANIQCKYYEPIEFHQSFKHSKFEHSYFHINCRGLSANGNNFRDLIYSMSNGEPIFDAIGISEVYNCERDTRLHLTGYHELITRTRPNSSRGGVGLFV